MTNKISSALLYPSKYIDVNGAMLHYIEQGHGDPIVFLHGIPTSSFLWRNIIPHVSSLGRCIAPDLIGMGKSAKPDIPYSISDHIAYIEKFIEVLNLKNITFVLHGWGSIIGFNYAMNHQDNCKGLVFYESYLRSLNGDDVSLPYQEQLVTLQEQASTVDLAQNGVYFIDSILPQSSLRQLTEDELSCYREPFVQRGSAKVLSQYVNDLLTIGNGGVVNKIIEDYSVKLQQSKLPKLMLYSVPGFITSMATAIWAKENLPNLEVVDVGEELHYAQESNPELMGETISIWLQGVEQQV